MSSPSASSTTASGVAAQRHIGEDVVDQIAAFGHHSALPTGFPAMWQAKHGHRIMPAPQLGPNQHDTSLICVPSRKTRSLPLGHFEDRPGVLMDQIVERPTRRSDPRPAIHRRSTSRWAQRAAKRRRWPLVLILLVMGLAAAVGAYSWYTQPEAGSRLRDRRDRLQRHDRHGLRDRHARTAHPGRDLQRTFRRGALRGRCRKTSASRPGNCWPSSTRPASRHRWNAQRPVSRSPPRACPKPAPP